jgi:hypothetical protein
MAVEVGTAYVTIAPSLRGFKQSFERGIGGDMKSMGSKASGDFAGEFEKQGKGKFKKAMGGLAKVGAAAFAAGGAIAAGAFLKDIVSEASNAQQSIGATEALFGKYSDTVIKKSKEAAQAVGLSGNEYRESSNLLAALFKNQGVAADELAEKTDQMVTLGADLAAMYGGTAATAVEGLTAAYKGEFNALEKYGISLRKSDINARLAAEGKDKLTGAALKQAEQEATTALIMEQSADAQGQAARESNTFAGQTQRLGAQMSNLKETLGMAVLPIVTKFATFLNENVVPAITGFIDGFKEGHGWGGKVRDIFETIGNVGQKAWDAIGTGVEWVRDLFTSSASDMESGGIGETLRNLKDTALNAFESIKEFWETNLKPALIEIGGIVMDAWTNKIQPALMGIWDTITTKVIPTVLNMWNNVLKPAFTMIGEFAMNMWNNFLKPALTALVDFIVNQLIPNALWLWNKVILPVFTKIGQLVQSVWVNMIQPNLQLLFNFISNVLAPVVLWLWKNVVVPAFEKIAAIIKWAWENVVRPVFNFLVDFISKTLLPKFGSIQATWETVWGAIEGAIDTAWTKVIKPTFDLLKSGVNAVKGAFERAKDGIGTAWNKVRQFVAKPIVAVLQFVNDGIIGGINKVLDWVGISGIPKIPIPASLYNAAAGNFSGIGARDSGTGRNGVVARADGGVLPGWSPGKDDLFFTGPAGNLALSGGEAIMRPEFTRAVGKDFIDFVNGAARHGGVGGVRKAMGFANGGVIGGKAGGGWWDTITGIGGGIVDFVKDPIGTLKGLLTNGISALANNPFTDFVGGFISKTVGGIKDKLWDMVFGSDEPDKGTANGAGMKWQSIWALINGVDPSTRMTSNYRKGAITASGWPSYHGKGRAVDVVSPNMARTFMRIRNLLPWSELYYSPAGPLQLRNGRQHIPTGITRANHFDHIHAAFKRGGIMPELFDKGGAIQPGVSLVANATRKPEQVLTAEQWDDVMEGKSGGDTYNLFGVPMNQTGEVAAEILFQQRRTRHGKYQNRR